MRRLETPQTEVQSIFVFKMCAFSAVWFSKDGAFVVQPAVISILFYAIDRFTLALIGLTRRSGKIALCVISLDPTQELNTRYVVFHPFRDWCQLSVIL